MSAMRGRQRSILSLFFIFLALLVLVGLGIAVFLKLNPKLFVGGPVWPVPKSIVVKATSVPLNKLRAAIETSLVGTEGTYAVVVKNLKTGEEASVNGERVFASASLYKLWVMGAIYEQVQLGKINLSDPIEEDVVGLNNYFGISPDTAELTEGTVSFSVESAIYQMITISHNYAALSLTKKIGLESLNRFLNEYGLYNVKVGGEPTITALDVALFLEKIYNGKVVSEEASKKMITVMIDQKKNERIPKYLPTGTKVAHKTGELDGVAHDAGIVFSQAGDYIIVLLSDSDNPSGAMEKEALVSKATYEYFSSQPAVDGEK